MRISTALFLILLPANALCAQQPAQPITCKSAPAVADEGTRALAAEHFADAESFYIAQLASTPTLAVYSGLVDAHIGADHIDQALATARQAVAATPNSGAATALLGDAELRAAQISEAEADYLAAVKMDFCSARAHYGLARLEALAAHNASAQKELITAHRLAITDAHISEALFATLPPAMHAKGLRNLLASVTDLPTARRANLDEQAALLERGATCQQAATSATTKVDLTRLYYGGDTLRDFGLHAIVNQADSVNLELDSTASGIVLTQTDATRLRIAPADPDHTTAPYLGYADTLKIGPLTFHGCGVSVVPDAQLASRYSLIGLDFFRNSLIDINWKGPELTLTPYPEANPTTLTDATVPPAEKDWTPILIDRARILMATTINKAPNGLFLLDTSRTPVVLSPTTVAAYMPGASSIGIYGVSGPVLRLYSQEKVSDLNRTDIISPEGKLLHVTVPVKSTLLQFGGTSHLPTGVVSFDITPISHDAGLEISGIVGYPVLSFYYVGIDYRNARIKLTQDVGYSH